MSSAGEAPTSGRHEHRVSRYLRLSRRERPAEGDGPPAFVGVAPVDDHLRSPATGMRTGALLALCDTLGGFTSGVAALPRWIVSTNLLVRVGALAHVGPLRLEAGVLRRGRTTVVTAVEVRDEGRHDAFVASSVITCSILDPGDMELPSGRAEVVAPPPAGNPTPFETFFGIGPDVGDRTVLEFEEHLRNPWGILHGGAVAALIDVAAERTARRHAASRGIATTGTGRWVCADTLVHFLRPVRVGPVEARGTVVGSRADGQVVTVDVYDRGEDARHACRATVSVVSV